MCLRKQIAKPFLLRQRPRVTSWTDDASPIFTGVQWSGCLCYDRYFICGTRLGGRTGDILTSAAPGIVCAKNWGVARGKGRLK